LLSAAERASAFELPMIHYRRALWSGFSAAKLAGAFIGELTVDGSTYAVPATLRLSMAPS